RRGGVVAGVLGLMAGTVLVDATPSAAAGSGVHVISTAAGGGTSTSLANGVASTSISLGSPVDAAYDPHGNVVIADQDNNVVRVAAASTGTFYGQAMTAGRIYTIIGDGNAGYSGDTVPKSSKVPNPLLAAELDDPNGIAIDAAGDIALADTGNDAIRFVPAVGGVRFGLSMTAGEIYTIAGGGSGEGNETFSAGLAEPDGIAFNPSGDVVVADTDNSVVRLIPATAHTEYGQSLQPTVIYTLAGIYGDYGYTGNGGPGYNAQVSLEPFGGIAVDPAGNVALSDSDNQVVRLVAAKTGSYHGRAVIAGDIYTIAGNTNEAFKGNKKPAVQASLDTPQGVAYDAAGDLYIADSANNVIRYVPAAKGSYDGKAVQAGYIYTIVGKGPMGASGDGGAASAAELNDPAGIEVGANGRLLISDGGNNKIRQVVPPSPAVSSLKPTSGPMSGGKKVTIKGVNLESVTAVYFGSRAAASFTIRNDQKIVAVSPASSVGTVVVRVVSPAGTSETSRAGAYTYAVAVAKKHHRRH
ncbi:MAG TPA: IPT/TIG domain-containing protein, partial [Acidimicrobiales bacterium]|nr:IPT/TIG domain-containing protein [Acidimicrobiales bacterium]